MCVLWAFQARSHGRNLAWDEGEAEIVMAEYFREVCRMRSLFFELRGARRNRGNDEAFLFVSVRK